MSWWERIKARLGTEAEEPRPVAPAPSPEPARSSAPVEVPKSPDAPGKSHPFGCSAAAPAGDELEPLLDLERGARVDPALALAALDRARGTASERRAIELAERAHRAGRAPEELLAAAARIFAARGQSERAVAILGDARSTPSLLLAADLSAEQNELGRALTLIERVLARDIDAPGARERHERWRRALGGAAKAAVSPLDQPTVLRTDAPETSLRIVGEAGRGGAGSVYEAIDDALGRRVALKVYHRPAEDREKLEREARTAVELAGPGVIRIFDIDLGRGFIVMEWLSGRALKHWVLAGDRAILWPLERWVVPLGQTLARIHAQGLVHGDLKPANVVFRSLEEPVLTDFGIACPRGTPLEGGSLGYVSPERMESASAQPSDDVYALGRVIEDALDALERAVPELGSSIEVARWRSLVPRLLAARSERPQDAAAALRLFPSPGTP